MTAPDDVGTAPVLIVPTIDLIQLCRLLMRVAYQLPGTSVDVSLLNCHALSPPT